MRYHISPSTGRPNICRAEANACPLGGAHYNSKEAAREGYEGENVNVAKPLKKNTFAEVDAPFPGMRMKGENLLKTRERLDAHPELTTETKLVNNEWVTRVYANGGHIFDAVDHREVAMVDRAIEANVWPKMRELLAFDASAASEVDDFLNGPTKEDLDEEVKALEEELTGDYLKWSPSSQAEYMQTVEAGRLAQKILKAEKKKK